MVVVDTNVISYVFGGDYRAHFYLEQIRGRRVLILLLLSINVLTN